MRHNSFGHQRRAVALAALILGVLAVHPRVSTTPAAQADAGAGRRLVLVALDAADWLVIDRLLASGMLPTFARLKAHGRTGLMIASPPLVSPMVWTTIATGVEPENHGILDFMQDLPGGRQTPVGSSQRLAPALWNLFSEAGKRVAIIGWWATWPAERVRGTIVSDALAPQLTRDTRPLEGSLVSPASAVAEVSSRVVKTSALTREDMAAYVPLTAAEFERAKRAAALPAGRFYEDRLAHLAAVIASSRTYAGISETLLRRDRPDLLAVYLEGIDTISHLFIGDSRNRSRAIEAAYKDADALLGRLARLSPPDTLVVLCSDHGFYAVGAGIVENPANLTGPATAWHRPYGIVGVATAGTLSGADEDPALPASTPIGSITPLDVAPTLLHAAGLPVSADMPGRVVSAMLPAEQAARAPRRALAAPFSPPVTPPGGRTDDAEVVARLQALGYVGTVKTSLARLNLAESLLRRGKLPQAERELRAVVAAQPENVSAWLWLAQCLARQQRMAEALTAYARAVALPEGAREALVAATDLAVREGRSADAKRLIDAARSPDAVAAAHIARGTLAEALRDGRAAEREYRAALTADPTEFDAAARLLDLLIKERRPQDALPAIQRVATRVPDSPRHAALLGAAHLAMRDGARAELAFRRALTLAPDSEASSLGLGRALLLQRKSKEAIDVLLPLAASAERDVLLGAAYSDVRDWLRASQRLQAAIDAGRSTPDVLNGLGWAQLQLGRKGEAAALLARSLKVNPDQPEIRQLLSQIQPKDPGGPR